MLILAAVLLVAAIIAGFFARSLNRRISRLTSTPTVSCAEAASGPNRLCEVAGVAEPGPRGTLPAPLSGQPCVWHRVEAIEHYWDTDSDGTRQDRTRTLSDSSSEAPFLLRDDSGTVLILPLEAHIDGPERTIERTNTDRSSGINLSFGSSDILGHRGRVVEKEWIIPPGQRLFVSGETSVAPAGGPATIGHSGHGELMISTRDEASVLRSVRRDKTIALVLAALLVIGAIVASVVQIAG